MPNSFRYVSNGPKKKKKIISCPRAGLPEGSPRLGSVSPFSYLLLQFSRFLQSDFCKMLVRGLSKISSKRIFEFLPSKIFFRCLKSILSKFFLKNTTTNFLGKHAKIPFSFVSVYTLRKLFVNF